MLIVKTQNRKRDKFLILGIITLHDILNYLVGKIDNNLERLLPSPQLSNQTSLNSTNLGSGDNPNKP